MKWKIRNENSIFQFMDLNDKRKEMYGKDLSEGENFSNKRNGKTVSIINIIPASIFLSLYLDDIMYPIWYYAQRLGSDQVRNTTNE